MQSKKENSKLVSFTTLKPGDAFYILDAGVRKRRMHKTAFGFARSEDGAFRAISYNEMVEPINE